MVTRRPRLFTALDDASPQGGGATRRLRSDTPPLAELAPGTRLATGTPAATVIGRDDLGGEWASADGRGEVGELLHVHGAQREEEGGAAEGEGGGGREDGAPRGVVADDGGDEPCDAGEEEGGDADPHEGPQDGATFESLQPLPHGP